MFRPNQAVAISNFQQLAPIILQAGGNPIAVVEEAVRRLDDNLDVTKFFPVGPIAPMPQPMQAGPQGQPGGGVPAPQNPGASVPQNVGRNAVLPGPALAPAPQAQAI